MSAWDFEAGIDGLVEVTAQGRGPETMAELMAAAEQIVHRLRRDDPDQLAEWLQTNAQMLIGQQLLVASVHGRHEVAGPFAAAVDEWSTQSDLAAAGGSAADASAAADWLREHHPGLLRAWLLLQIPSLLAAYLAGRP